MRCARRLSIWWGAFAIAFILLGVVRAEPTVWSGLTFEFTRPSFASPAPVDQITPSVALARDEAQGLYNAAQEMSYNDDGDPMKVLSPLGTRWATNINNMGKEIRASNHAALDFESNGTWLAAYGGGSVGANIEGRDAVVHIVAEDIYLDLRFTDWVNGLDEGGGGGFTYMRAVAPTAPAPTGDYNDNGAVDAADYVLWRDTLGQSIAVGEGADGNANGEIDAGDFEFWRTHFGENVPGAAASAKVTSVPEPATFILSLYAILWLSRLRQRASFFTRSLRK
jgi:hypothetical protein